MRMGSSLEGLHKPEANDRMHVVVNGRLLARNTLLNLIGQAAPLLVGVVTLPFIVHGLGAERFGLLSLSWVVLGYFTIFDLGLGRAATKYVAEALARGEKDRVPRLVWTSVTAQIIFGVVGAVTLVATTPLLVEYLLNIPPALVGEAKATFYLLAMSIPAVLISSSLTGVLAATQRFDLVNAVGASFSVINSLLTVMAVVSWNWHLPQIVAMLVASRFLASGAYYWLCLRVFPALKGLPRCHRRELETLIGFGGWLTVSSIVGPILVYLDRFMIGALLTMAAVAYYSAPYEMVTRLWIIPSSFVATLFPAFSVLSGQRQSKRLAFFFARSTQWVLLTLGSLVVVLIVFAYDILQLWLGSAFAVESTGVLQILAVGVLVNSLAHVPYSLLQAQGRPDVTAKLHLVELPLHGVLVWWLISLWGTPGAALAWTVRVAVDALLLAMAARHLTMLPLRTFVSAEVIQTLLFLCLFTGILFAINSLLLAVGPRLLGLGLTVLLGSMLVWHYVIDGKDRDQILKLFGQRV
jgi:O-antigen/teichoic acid export membrane protein